MASRPKFSSLVKKWRTAQQLTITEAARRLRIPYRTFQDWELGNKTPTGIRRLLLEKLLMNGKVEIGEILRP
jgi:DNA-binding transcriptional regulator YiaG